MVYPSYFYQTTAKWLTGDSEVFLRYFAMRDLNCPKHTETHPEPGYAVERNFQELLVLRPGHLGQIVQLPAVTHRSHQSPIFSVKPRMSRCVESISTGV